MKLSIVIKARNEADNIARCLTSAVAAAERFGGEVILADSGSTDATVQLAAAFPVRIVQLEPPRDARCGVGPQLGFQQARGTYVYMLDGDMEVQLAFVERALTLLEQQPELAGVGGYIREMRAKNFDFQRRNARQAELIHQHPTETECLSGGGLYRRAALLSVGYMSDRNLHALEEYDLGTRLRLGGWRLLALPDHAADHYSYDLGTLALLKHRLRGGNYLAQGELLRAAYDGGYVRQALTEIRAYRFSIAVLAYWGVALLGAAIHARPALVLLAALLGMILAGVGLSASRRDLRSGLLSVLVWHFTAAGLIRQRRDVREAIGFRILAEGRTQTPPAVPLKRVS
jgi:GT2 family glycosyltransferase